MSSIEKCSSVRASDRISPDARQSAPGRQRERSYRPGKRSRGHRPPGSCAGHASGWRIGAAAARPRPAAATAAGGRIRNELSSNGRPGVLQDIRTPHLRAALPVDAYSLAVSCGGRGVSLDIWPASLSAPAAPRVARFLGHDRDRSRSRAPRRATTWSPLERRTHRPAARLSRALAWLPWPLLVRPCPRATANMAHGAFAMRRPPTAAQPQRRHVHTFRCFTTPDTSSGHVARGATM